MNTVLLKENNLEINAYLDEINVNQSGEEDDTEDDEFLTVNPSGSVLQPAFNPYNKQRKIAEANETLFSEEVVPKSPQKVKFDKVEKRICYDYFGSSFESDSIKSCEDEESEKESLLQLGTKQKNDSHSEPKSNYLQPQNPASKVVVTVTSPKKDEVYESESESEDVCVGRVPNLKDSTETDKEEDVDVTSPVLDQDEDEEEPLEIETEKEGNYTTEKKECHKGKIKGVINTTKVAKFLTDTKASKSKLVTEASVDNFKDLEKFDIKDDNKIIIENPPPKNTSFYPCLANHTGITIRITGADSIESVDSESTDNDVQVIEKYNYQQNLEMKQDGNYIPIRLSDQNIRSKVTKLQISEQTFILKGIKSNTNIRSPKHNNKFEVRQYKKSIYKTDDNEKAINKSKTKQVANKTDGSASAKPYKYSSKIKNSFSHTSNKSKVVEDKNSEECLQCIKKVRPKSCVEKGSTKVVVKGLRPVTAPAKRPCCPPQPHLPEYNGLRSEYGLSAEQLAERKRHKVEAQKVKKQRKEQKWMEEQQKRKENEEKFIAWLENKRKQSQMQYLRNQKIQAESGIKIYPAPTAHLKRTGAVRSRKLFKSQRKCVSLEEILSNANSHENKTYKIYLGLSFE